MAAARAHVLGLYRKILRAATNYPSRNAPRIVAEVKQEFRDNAAVSDAAKVAACVKEAEDGLAQLLIFQTGEGELAGSNISLNVGEPAYWNKDGPFGGGDR